MFQGAVKEILDKMSKEREEKQRKEMVYKTCHPYLYKLNLILDKVMFLGAIAAFLAVAGLPLQLLLFIIDYFS